MPGQDSAGCGPHGRQHRGVAPRAEPPGRAARRQPAGCAAGALLWLGGAPQGAARFPRHRFQPAPDAAPCTRCCGCGGAPSSRLWRGSDAPEGSDAPTPLGSLVTPSTSGNHSNRYPFPGRPHRKICHTTHTSRSSRRACASASHRLGFPAHSAGGSSRAPGRSGASPWAKCSAARAAGAVVSSGRRPSPCRSVPGTRVFCTPSRCERLRPAAAGLPRQSLPPLARGPPTRRCGPRYGLCKTSLFMRVFFLPDTSGSRSSHPGQRAMTGPRKRAKGCPAFASHSTDAVRASRNDTRARHRHRRILVRTRRASAPRPLPRAYTQ